MRGGSHHLNLDKVIERFSVISNISLENSAKWVGICKESLDEIESRLREGVDKEKNARRLEVAAAALALYKYTLYNSVTVAVESFSAGELRIKPDFKGSVKMAYRAWQEAKNSISDLLKDENFIFERIAF